MYLWMPSKDIDIELYNMLMSSNNRHMDRRMDRREGKNSDVDYSTRSVTNTFKWGRISLKKSAKLI